MKLGKRQRDELDHVWCHGGTDWHRNKAVSDTLRKLSDFGFIEMWQGGIFEKYRITRAGIDALSAGEAKK